MPVLDAIRSAARCLRRRLDMVRPVADRKGHDRHYSLDMNQDKRRIGLAAAVTLDDGLASTVAVVPRQLPPVGPRQGADGRLTGGWSPEPGRSTEPRRRASLADRTPRSAGPDRHV